MKSLQDISEERFVPEDPQNTGSKLNANKWHSIKLKVLKTTNS